MTFVPTRNKVYNRGSTTLPAAGGLHLGKIAALVGKLPVESLGIAMSETENRALVSQEHLEGNKFLCFIQRERHQLP